MGVNFHEPFYDFAGTLIQGILFARTRCVADELNLPLVTMDAAIDLIKNVVVCPLGYISYVPGTGVLTWSDPISIIIIDESGNEFVNAIAPGAITIGGGQILYVDLNLETNGAAVVLHVMNMPTGGESGVLGTLGHIIMVTGFDGLPQPVRLDSTLTRLVMGTRAAASGTFYPLHLQI